MFLRRDDRIGLLIWLGVVLALSLALLFFTPFYRWLCLLLATNTATFLVMFIDKVQATMGDRRISERSLYLMTFLGGSVGMLLAMYLIRHKSRKLSFQLVVWALVIVQLVLVYRFIEMPTVLFPQPVGPFGV